MTLIVCVYIGLGYSTVEVGGPGAAAGGLRPGRQLPRHVEAVRHGVGQRLRDVDARAAAGRRRPQRGVDGRRVGRPAPGAGRWCARRTGPPHAAPPCASRPHQSGLPQPAPGQVDPAQIRPAEHREGEVDLVEHDRSQPAVLERRAQRDWSCGMLPSTVRRNRQLRKADPWCTDSPRSAPPKSHSVNTARSVRRPARSSSRKSWPRTPDRPSAAPVEYGAQHNAARMLGGERMGNADHSRVLTYGSSRWRRPSRRPLRRRPRRRTVAAWYTLIPNRIRCAGKSSAGSTNRPVAACAPSRWSNPTAAARWG
jgi:hypothetical protein